MNARLRAYLVDDELPALKRLSRLLDATGRVEIIGSTTSPEEALQFLSADQPDVLFLDIQMPVMNGFDLLTRLNRQPFVVFTTAYDQYALKAFEVNSIDYLLKPVDPEQLRRALDKLGRSLPDAREFRALLQDLSRNFPERIPVRIGDRTQFLRLTGVTHFFARDKLTYAATETRNYCIDWPITEMEPKLDPAKFFRIHRAVIVNLDWIEELTPLFAGRLMVRLRDRNHTELTVARDRARAFKTRLLCDRL